MAFPSIWQVSEDPREAPFTPREDLRSYLVRRGRTGPTSRAAHARLWPLHGVSDVADLVAPQVVEVGFGMGEATAELAAREPGRRVLAVDVHPAGVMALLRRIEERGLTNVQVWEGDAVPVLQALTPGSVEELRLFFPDPWPKPRHAKRRLVRPSFVALLDRVLAPEGFVHLATDRPEYEEHAREAFAAWDLVEDRRGRPQTGYERRAHLAGRTPVDLVIRRAGGAAARG